MDRLFRVINHIWVILVCIANKLPCFVGVCYERIGSEGIKYVDESVPFQEICCMPRKLLELGIGLHHVVLLEKLHTDFPNPLTLRRWCLLYAGPSSWMMCQEADDIHGKSSHQHCHECATAVKGHSSVATLFREFLQPL